MELTHGMMKKMHLQGAAQNFRGSATLATFPPSVAHWIYEAEE